MLSKRHTQDPHLFAKKDWMDKSGANQRQKTISVFQSYAERFHWNKNSDLPVILCVHGTDLTVAKKICSTGFATLSLLDKGYYGQGVYFSTHIPYLFPYLVRHKNPTIIVTMVVPGNVYPVIEGPRDENSCCGQPLMAGYQSHYVITSRKGYPQTDLDNPESYDELVIVQEPQTLPIYLLEVDPNSFQNLLSSWQREIPDDVRESDLEYRLL